jgi:hypothetical protein
LKTFGTKELAAKIRRKGESEEAAVNRIKSWVREGLFYNYLEDSEPGTGQSRRYRAPAQIDAALYEMLTRSLKAPANALTIEVQYLRNQVMKGAKQRTADFLVIAYNPDTPDKQPERKPVKADDLTETLSSFSEAVFVLIDIHKTINRLSEV